MSAFDPFLPLGGNDPLLPIADVGSHSILGEMRNLSTAVGIIFAAGPLSAQQPMQSLPLYQSVEDPAGQQAREITVDDNVLAVGQLGDDAKSLLRSDLGFPLYFVRVDGGVRVRGQPIVFPSGSRTHFNFQDFSCRVLGGGPGVDVLCRSNADGQLYRSRIVDGGLASFEMRCFDQIQRVCHYELKGGSPLRPSKVEAE